MSLRLKLGRVSKPWAPSFGNPLSIYKCKFRFGNSSHERCHLFHALRNTVLSCTTSTSYPLPPYHVPHSVPGVSASKLVCCAFGMYSVGLRQAVSSGIGTLQGTNVTLLGPNPVGVNGGRAWVQPNSHPQQCRMWLDIDWTCWRVN